MGVEQAREQRRPLVERGRKWRDAGNGSRHAAENAQQMLKNG
jgi:hypothetical protein